MKVSSLGKDETLYLLELYKSLQQVDEELDSYISNTAAPEVDNIKKAIEIKQKSDEEATEILNSNHQIKDTKKMINLLEEYLDSSDKIESSNAKSRQIMYVIEELIDKKNDIENEIRTLENREKIEKTYDEIEIIDSSKCKIINCDIKFKDSLTAEYNKKEKPVLVNRKNDVTEELIKFVEEHLNDKTKEEEEKLKIVNFKKESDDKKEEINIQKIIDLDNKVVIEEPKKEIEEQIIEELPTPMEEVEVVEENYVPITDIIDQDNVSSDEETIVSNIDPLDRQFEELNKAKEIVKDEVKEENIKYVDDEVHNKKIAKVPPQKRDRVFAVWEGSFEIPTIKKIENNKGIINLDAFINGKAA